MIDKVTRNDANGLEPSRILARQLARPLTDNEIEHVGGGMRAVIGHVTAVRCADTCSGTGCPENDSDA